ncbi:proline racemase family protein [Roseovarius sp. Pro17]|uniref:proline racemase family protein n=1 Tax=Roseovarius sp. Pro17 TaxID=3108175 RepID=UPI002D770A1F|nr:proline racemase family protein [Roseovarius sp. Pro17]
MKRAAYIDATYTQTEGETTCIINGQFHFPAGLDLLGKREYFKEHYDWIRAAIIREPRGHNDLFGAVIVPSSTPDADIGIIWIDSVGYGDMCGHGTIATSMLLASNNLVPRQNGETELRIENPAGIVTSTVGIEDGEVKWCRFQNVPGFLAQKDIKVDVPEVGEMLVDISFGGNYFMNVKLDPEICRVAPENAAKLGRMGNAIKKQINDKITMVHPDKPNVTEVDLVTFYQKPEDKSADYRWVHAFRDGALDRSPGGTGMSAMLAMLEARGEISMGQTIHAQGLLGTGTFEGKLIKETTVGDHRAVVPTIKGRSTLIGFGKWYLDPMDKNGRGYAVGRV